MYYVIVLFVMFIFPIGSIITELVMGNGSNFLILIGKWFVFWAIGIRFVTAQEELEGYKPYAKQVRYHLLPNIW